MIAVFFIVYMITFSYIEDRDVHHYIIHTTIDDQIPFCEYFIVPYLIWFLFVAVTVFYFMFFNKNQWKEYYQLIITLGTGMTLFLIISLVFPNGQDLRPVLTGDSIFIKAVQMIYHTDTPTNVLPSIHVYNSVAAFSAIHTCKKLQKHKGIRIGAFILTTLIILSTMFIKQHSCIDVMLGILLGILMNYAVYRTSFLVKAHDFIRKLIGNHRNFSSTLAREIHSAAEDAEI